ncbi:hypothetical protein [Aquipuribacter sp. SD81]|uniref:hypothetical protein n=1 Tax=Aquipuribacter sp. SD81 TaxID=3127703 RepID=UPI00301932EE
MPTTRPRHFVTETDELREALDLAARTWPDLSRPQLLVRLALEGYAAVTLTADARRQQRQAALAEQAGRLTGVFGADHLADLREDWPA